jgi:hypothetical protein
MKKLLFLMFFLSFYSVAEAKDLQHFNPGVFGHSTTESLKLLYDKKPGDIEPIIVQVDVKDGIFYAGTVIYPDKITLEEARASLNQIYKKYENQKYAKDAQIGIWRVAERNFTIMLAEEDDQIQVMYISFQPTKYILRRLEKFLGTEYQKLISQEQEQNN